MRSGIRWSLGLLPLVTVAAVLALVELPGCAPVPGLATCATETDDATINVAGTFRYSGNGANAQSGQAFELTGTITFEQQDSMVRVNDTTYDFSGLRRLESEFAELRGNALFLALNPINGDTDYQAAVKFVFDDDGNSFCVQFTDTNNDQGGLGSFSGVRIESE